MRSLVRIQLPRPRLVAGFKHLAALTFELPRRDDARGTSNGTSKSGQRELLCVNCDVDQAAQLSCSAGCPSRADRRVNLLKVGGWTSVHMLICSHHLSVSISRARARARVRRMQNAEAVRYTWRRRDESSSVHSWPRSYGPIISHQLHTSGSRTRSTSLCRSGRHPCP
jgi:hypothetical protein